MDNSYKNCIVYEFCKLLQIFVVGNIFYVNYFVVFMI